MSNCVSYTALVMYICAFGAAIAGGYFLFQIPLHLDYSSVENTFIVHPSESDFENVDAFSKVFLFLSIIVIVTSPISAFAILRLHQNNGDGIVNISQGGR